MIKNYLKVAIRNLLRQKGISFVNIFGLSVSLAVSLLLFLFVNFELSFDSFNEKKHRTYRLVTAVEIPNGETLVAPLTTGSVSEELSSRVAHIEKITKLDRLFSEIRYNNIVFKELNILRADSNFFHIFSFNAIEGDPTLTLSRPNEIAITQSTAKKIFGAESPVGKVIDINNQSFEVTTLLADTPSNSHFKFDALTSFLDIRDFDHYLNKRGVAFPCYFTTHKPLDKEAENEIIDIAEQISNVRMKHYGLEVSLSAQKLLDIHLHSKGYQYDIDGTGNISQIYLFGFIAMLLLVISIINFINLIIAKSETRNREIGLRKVCGAHKKNIIFQFLGESILISIISVVLAIFIAEISLPLFSNLVEKEIPLTLLQPLNIAMVIGLGLITGIMAGLYPSFYLSSYSAKKALKNEKSKRGGLSFLQVSLVMVQFSISIFLLYGVITLYRQVSFLKSKELGFDNRTYVISDLTGRIVRNYHNIKNELEQISGVTIVSGSQSIPGRQSTIQNVIVEGQNKEQVLLVQENKVQDGYLNTLGISIISGRDFYVELASDSSAYILNETAVKTLGLNNPIGVRICVNNRWGTVIGVTPDYHTRSLHSEIEPLVLSRDDPNPYYILINIKSQNLDQVVEKINRTIQVYDPNWDVNGQFINDFFNGQYRREEKLNKLFTASALLSIIIGTMGLFALTFFITIRRTKEVGIRKTLGASTLGITVKICWGIVRWVIISSLISLPIAWYAMDGYLQTFPYRISQDWWVFLASSLISITLALTTIVWLTVKVASENPINALRYE